MNSYIVMRVRVRVRVRVRDKDKALIPPS